jgi:hypothetical protein
VSVGEGLYAAASVLAAMVVANWWWQQPQYGVSGTSRGLDTAAAFVLALVLWPLVAAVGCLAGLFWAGSWLLPAVRASRRAERAEREQATAEAQRDAVDRMHRELGLPPVDWSGAR